MEAAVMSFDLLETNPRPETIKSNALPIKQKKRCKTEPFLAGVHPIIALPMR